MALTRIQLENFTVFRNTEIEFSPGMNIFLGENGLGKTHIMKLLYAACQSSQGNIGFPDKTVKVFLPESGNIRRLVNRDKAGSSTAQVQVSSDAACIGMKFTSRTKKWDANVTGRESWEAQLQDMSSVFIPAKEILSNAWNLSNAVKMKNVEFDDTYLDLIAAASVNITLGPNSNRRKKLLDRLNKISSGKVLVEEERFYLKPGNQARLEFPLVAEGLRKVALLWQLIKNGTLEAGSVLFWDEPEANINPRYIPEIADILLELQREGTQIFISTHDYFLCRYLDVRRKENNALCYHSLYRQEDTGTIQVETAENFRELEHNAIMTTFMALYEDELRKALE